MHQEVRISGFELQRRPSLYQEYHNKVFPGMWLLMGLTEDVPRQPVSFSERYTRDRQDSTNRRVWTKPVQALALLQTYLMAFEAF